MPLLDDLVANPKKSHEVFNANIGTLEVVTREVANQMFPNLKLEKSENITYFPFKLCHSMPTVNARGRTFTPRVLANSFATLNDQLIDWDHHLKDNRIGADDRIIGFVKGTNFSLPEDWDDSIIRKETASATTLSPIPVWGLGTLFLRAAGVADAIEQHVNKKQKWSVSMECGHHWKDAFFWYENEFIPVKDAEIAMRDCVSFNAIAPYKGRRLAACLGGLEGHVDFWGVGFTQDPADRTPDLIMNFIGGNGEELASRKIFHMPLMAYSNKELEVANSSVDKKIHELASVEVIGHTEPAEDGHQHEVLSNLTIIPAAGHSHSCLHGYDGGQISISRGSNPTITGVTTTHHQSGCGCSCGCDPCVSSGNTPDHVVIGDHLHLIKIPLKGKLKAGESYTDDVDSSEEIANLLGEDVAMKVSDLVKRLEAATDKVVKATTDAEKSEAQREVANVRKDIAELENREVTEKEKKDFLQAEIDAGRVVTREKANEEKDAAVEEEKKRHEQELKNTEKRNQRLQKCLEANIDLDVEFEGVVGQDGKPMTLRKRVEIMPTDESGDQQFNMDFAVWSRSPDLLKEVPAEAQAEAQQTNVNSSTQQAEAANTSNKGSKRIIAAAGGGSSTGGSTKQAEVANKDGKGRTIPAHLMGRRSIPASK